VEVIRVREDDATKSSYKGNSQQRIQAMNTLKQQISTVTIQATMKLSTGEGKLQT
jgi:hypothetical protein